MKSITLAAVLVALWQLLCLIGAGTYAVAIAGGEASVAHALLGIVFLMARMLSIVLAPPLVAAGLVQLVRMRQKNRAEPTCVPPGRSALR
jgi:hypothetical protein